MIALTPARIAEVEALAKKATPSPVLGLVDFEAARKLERLASPDFMLALIARVRELERGEYICRKCGLRKDSEPCDTGGHF